MKATFKTRNVYGNALIYPVNSLASQLCQLANKKTLSIPELNLIQSMGIGIEVDNMWDYFHGLVSN